MDGNSREAREAPNNGRRNGYSELEWASLRVYAEGLIGRPDVPGLIARLGYADEAELRDKEGRSLIDLFEEGNVFDNLLRMRERLSVGRLGRV